MGPLLILATIALFAVDQWLGIAPGAVLTVVALVLASLGAREVANIASIKGLSVPPITLAAGACLGVLAIPWLSRLTQDGAAIIAGAAIVSMSIAVIPHLTARRPQGALHASSLTLLCFTHLGLALGFHIALRQETSAWFLLWVVAMTKACDTFAYFTGTAIGKHKLIAWLSPGKTWEGLAGGIVGSIVVAGAFWFVLPETATHSPWLILATGLILACTGQAGDLLVSLYKRDAAMKDSGQVLPGFGGVLDVLDSPLLVGPVAFVWFSLVLGL